MTDLDALLDTNYLESTLNIFSMGLNDQKQLIDHTMNRSTIASADLVQALTL